MFVSWNFRAWMEFEKSSIGLLYSASNSSRANDLTRLTHDFSILMRSECINHESLSIPVCWSSNVFCFLLLQLCLVPRSWTLLIQQLSYCSETLCHCIPNSPVWFECHSSWENCHESSLLHTQLLFLTVCSTIKWLSLAPGNPNAMFNLFHFMSLTRVVSITKKQLFFYLF